jgi:DNA-3-methyladenine glycosylase II
MRLNPEPGGDLILLTPPAPFSFAECLAFLDRSPLECTHAVAGGAVYKPVELDGEPVLLRITAAGDAVAVAALNRRPDAALREAIATYVWDWWDLGRDLAPFCRLAARDRLLGPLAARYHGLRLIGIPDLFEALSWAIIGQQVNLTFAYTLKRRLVETFGAKLPAGDRTYWLFPAAAALAQAAIGDLRRLQFTTGKAEYIIGLARQVHAGTLHKQELLAQTDPPAQRERLMRIRGVGRWTADYVGMKCLKDMTALPLADVGLQNAIKLQLGLSHKPTAGEIRSLAATWKGWEAYATFYLWRSLFA